MADNPHNLGAQFQAKYDGTCPVCTLAVYEGDLMGYVDDQAVCDGCYNDAETENWQEIRSNIRKQQEEDRAKDPEAYDRRQASVNRFLDGVRNKAAEDYSAMVRKQAELHPGKEWVPAPQGKTPGFIHVTPHLETPTEQEDLMAVEPGIQALMAAGLLEGQEPGGNGVCNATLTTADGKVTEVAIPVPPVAAPAEVVPSTGSVEDAAAAALARARSAGEDDYTDPDYRAARVAQLAANAAAVDLPALMADPVPAPQPDALQAGLQAAVDSGAMTPDQAEALGWVAPAPVSPVAAAGPRTTAALDDFKANYDNPAADLFIDALAAARSMPEEDAILGALDNLTPYVGPVDRETAKRSLLGVITDAIDSHPRSLQKTIGPSEIGTECDHCLAAKLAGWDQVREGAWLPTVGTAVHSWLEESFKYLTDANGRPRYLTERRVEVGAIGGQPITGSTDLVDLAAGMTWDWKIVGATTLKSAKVSPSQRYIIQQMLYARGWRRLGVLITHVGIAFLPRNDASLNKAVFWTAPYDEALADAALDRADRMAANLKAMESLGVEARDKFITGLPRWRSWRAKDPVSGVEKLVKGNAQEGQIECLDCARYPDYPADPAQALKQLDGLL